MLWRAEPEQRSRWSAKHAVVILTVLAGLLVAATTALAVGGVWPFSASDRTPSRAAATTTPTATTKRFDVRRAMQTARMQVDAGPRPAGSKALRRVAERLKKALPEGRFEAVPGHPGLRNIVGSVAGSGPVLVIASHYDTLSYPKGSLGANNAAAGVGAVIELARVAKAMRRPVTGQGIRFVLFDGEQSPSPDEADFYATALRGSRAYVNRHAEEVQALVLLDYVANKNIVLPREGTSDAALWAQVRAAAKTVGVERVFPDAVGESIIDDTTPFQQAGIPTANLIDWTDPHRHKLSDTFDKLSPASLDAVGETVAQLILDRDRRPREASQLTP